MAQITRLLSHPERIVLNGFRRLAPFRKSYDLSDLAFAARDLRKAIGPHADPILSQMLIVDREFALYWPNQSWSRPGYPAATASERLLLNMVFCAQSSQFRLEWLLVRNGRSRASQNFMPQLRRLAALLLMAGLVLPDPMRPSGPASRGQARVEVLSDVG